VQNVVVAIKCSIYGGDLVHGIWESSSAEELRYSLLNGRGMWYVNSMLLRQKRELVATAIRSMGDESILRHF
jgi:hypothetical protein